MNKFKSRHMYLVAYFHKGGQGTFQCYTKERIRSFKDIDNMNAWLIENASVENPTVFNIVYLGREDKEVTQ